MKRPLGKIAAAFFVLVLATSAATPAHAQTFKVLYNFKGAPDGANPIAALIMDAAGNLYGTTLNGGSPTCSPGGGPVGCGTVFRLDPSGNETVLHSFTGPPDGIEPWAGLLMDAAGNLYGTTLIGGSASGFPYGTVFKLDLVGNETVLHNFPNSPGDGKFPEAALAMDPAGNLYGTTFFGGASNSGTLFKLDTSDNETVLHNFPSAPGDGSYPIAALIRDAAGNRYGTTYAGGSLACTALPGFAGCGTVFRLDASGNETVLYSFAGGNDGAGPEAPLIMDTAGNLYGTSALGGSFGKGIVFKLDPSGHETVVHTFTGSDGANPFAGLIMDAAGNLYGTTTAGGPFGRGTVFKLDPSGNVTVLHAFTGGSDGSDSHAALIMDAAGNLYGTTDGGGTSGFGTVFKLTVQTPQQATHTIINSVNALFSQGVLNGGQDNSLVVKLQHAIDLMNAGKNAAAIGNLNAFISEVNDLLSSGVLSPSQAAPLVSAAESVIARLS